jgi:hypothetical protein
MKNTLTLIHAAVVLIGASTCPGYNYQRVGPLPPIKLTYDDVNNILSGLRSQVPLTSDDEYERVQERLTISGDGMRISKEGDPTLSPSDRLPNVGQGLSYYYRYSKGKVTEVFLNLSEHTRDIQIEGPSVDSVDALYAFLRDRFAKHRVAIGGATFRLVGGAILLVSASLLWISSFPPTNPVRIGRMATPAFLYLAIFVLPFSRWFPGFAIYSSSGCFSCRGTGKGR